MKEFWDDLRANEKRFKEAITKRILMIFVYIVLFAVFELFVIVSGGDFFHGAHALNVLYVTIVDALLILGAISEYQKIWRSYREYVEEKERLWEVDFVKFKAMMAIRNK